MVRPKRPGDEGHPDNLLKVVYDHGRIYHADETFDEIKKRVAKEWAMMAADKTHDVMSQELKEKQSACIKKIKEEASYYSA